MDSDIELQSLMARYQKGDCDAAAALVNRLSPQLHRFFLIQFVSRRHADDLLQETWLRIHEVRHTYLPGRPLLPWLYAIARNVRVDHYRKAHRDAGREQQLEEHPEIPAAPPESAADLEALLASLPDSQREVIAMLKVNGMSLEEVAHATSSTVGSVKQKAHRAYDRLRKGLAAMGRSNVRGRGLS
jgi:RNA polymerase sigma-70 factor (ECF subfamily)